MMRTKMSSSGLLLTLAFLVGGCDHEEGQLKDDRAEPAFQSAMADYTSGRIEAAVKGFEKVVRVDPGNASARFQLAYLLQDHRHDYLGALCNYREYLQQAPGSDKAGLAHKRLAICERHVAVELAKKHNISDAATLATENERLKVELKEQKDRNADLDEELRKTIRKLESLERDNAKVRQMLGRVGGGDEHTSARPRVDVSNAKLLDDADDVAKIDMKRLKEFKDDEAAENAGAVRPDLPKAAGLRTADEQAARTNATVVAGGAQASKTGGNSLDVFGIMGGGKARKEAKAGEATRPATYVVKEGDTLYRIALEFYGRRDAWRKIRDANPLKISTDCKVRAGDVLKLP